MSSQICSRHGPLVCSGIKCESSYESETCFRAQYAVLEKESTISLSEPVTSLKCPQRSVEEEVGSCSVVKASSKPSVANHKWKLRLGVYLPQVPYAFDFFFFHRRLRSCWIYARSAAVDPFVHTCSHAWKDEQKNYIWLLNGTSCCHQCYHSFFLRF